MTAVVPDVDQLRATVAGTVITADDPDYNEARKVWNGATDRRPGVIVRCASAADVSVALAYAREHRLEVAVRGGSHSTSGASMLDDGLVIDLSRMNSVSVDPQARRAKVGGGALLSDLDAATLEHGLAVPAGLVSHTGVGGLTVGGGMGWLSRKYGLTIDNLVSAEVVLADGRVLRTSADEKPDLFWALRGAGANFGVVTEFEFQLHPVNPMVHMGLFFWPLEQGKDVLARYRELIADLHPELNVVFGALNAPPAPFVPPEHHFKPGYVIVLVSFAGPELHAQAAEQFTSGLPPLFDMVTPMPYVALQQMLDEANHHGLYAWEKGLVFTELTDAGIDTITSQVAKKQSPLSLFLFYRLDNAYCSVADDATSYGGPRIPQSAAFLIGVSPDAAGLVAERDWVRQTWAALQPHVPTTGAYVNGVSDYDELRVRNIYGDKYPRLAALKAKYDPTNVFHRTAAIQPAS